MLHECVVRVGISQYIHQRPCLRLEETPQSGLAVPMRVVVRAQARLHFEGVLAAAARIVQGARKMRRHGDRSFCRVDALHGELRMLEAAPAHGIDHGVDEDALLPRRRPALGYGLWNSSNETHADARCSAVKVFEGSCLIVARECAHGERGHRAPRGPLSERGGGELAAILANDCSELRIALCVRHVARGLVDAVVIIKVELRVRAAVGLFKREDLVRLVIVVPAVEHLHGGVAGCVVHVAQRTKLVPAGRAAVHRQGDDLVVVRQEGGLARRVASTVHARDRRLHTLGQDVHRRPRGRSALVLDAPPAVEEHERVRGIAHGATEVVGRGHEVDVGGDEALADVI
mmetsp:Transcript_8319/g.33699  ORF Transcript_8319/g.33699 Transcript_8319/m.33699 type:complete len:345 (-) Transcript_8319:293-1327(-)